jgi:hypothetical protein
MSKSGRELAQITIDLSIQMITDTLYRMAYDKSLYTGEDEKRYAVFDMLKHCLIFKLDYEEYISELIALDASFAKPAKEALLDFPDLTDPVGFIVRRIEKLEIEITRLRLEKEKLLWESKQIDK